MKKTKEIEQLSLAGTEEAEILSRLSERVERAVSTIQELRRERDQLRAQVDALENRVREQEGDSTRFDSLEKEHERFRRERGEIRNRITSILTSLESLDTSD